jgi:hypothetical protein
MSNELLLSPRLVLRVGTLGNRQFGIRNGIEDDPARLERAAAAQCREALEAVRGIVAKIHTEEQRSVFPAIERPGLFCFTNFFGWVFGHADWWRRKKLAGQRAPAFSDERPLIQILSGLAAGADQMVVREAQAGPAATGESTDPVFECLGVVVEEEGSARPTMDRWENSSALEHAGERAAPARRSPSSGRGCAAAHAGLSRAVGGVAASLGHFAGRLGRGRGGQGGRHFGIGGRGVARATAGAGGAF